MDDGGYLSDVAKELVSKPSALGCTLDESSDIVNFNLCWGHFLWLDSFCKGFDLPVMNGHFGNVWIYCGEWIVAGLRLLCPCQGVEKCGFADVWITNDPAGSRESSF